MSIKVFDTKEVQDLLKAAANLGSQDGSARAKEITHRLLSDLFKAIDDLDMTPDEIWAGVTYFNKLGQDGEAALLAAGLGLEKYLDIRMDAEDREADIHGGTPRTIEGPLYVAGAPEQKGFARLDQDEQPGETLFMQGQVRDKDGKPLAHALVEVWHANHLGSYSFFDPSQTPFNLRSSIRTDAEGRYRFRSRVPVGYSVPPGGATDRLLKKLGRHGTRPAHIHFFVSAPGYRKLTTQINIAGDPYLWDDFAFATREGLVPEMTHVTDAAAIRQHEVDAPFYSIDFDFMLHAEQADLPTAEIRRDRAAA